VKLFGDPVAATGLHDRRLHHAIVMQIEGASYRMRQNANLVLEAIRPNASTAPTDMLPRRRGAHPSTEKHNHKPKPSPLLDLPETAEPGDALRPDALRPATARPLTAPSTLEACSNRYRNKVENFQSALSGKFQSALTAGTAKKRHYV